MLGARGIALNLRRQQLEQRYKKVHEALKLFLARSRVEKLDASATAIKQRADAQRRARTTHEREAEHM